MEMSRVLHSGWVWTLTPIVVVAFVLSLIPGVPFGLPYLAAKASGGIGWLSWRMLRERWEYAEMDAQMGASHRS